MKVKTKKVYIAEDGTEFNSDSECIAHELKLKEEEKNTSYWKIINQPDLTEGRGWYGLKFVKVKVPDYVSSRNMLEDYCFRTYGRPVAFVQGCAPVSNWEIFLVDREQFLKGGKISVGDYSYEGTFLDLIMGEKEQGLIEKDKK